MTFRALAFRQSDWAMIQEGRGGGKGVWDSFRVNVCFIQREASHEKLPAWWLFMIKFLFTKVFISTAT